MKKINKEQLPELDFLCGKDNDPLVDSRYQQSPILEIPKETQLSPSSFSYLSAEVKRLPKYQIRTPEQQADWTKQKTYNVRSIGACLLLFSNVVDELINLAETSPKRLFGKLIGEEGKKSIRYSSSYTKEALSILYKIKKTTGDEEKKLIDKVTTEYNLSFVLFTKDMYELISDEFYSIKELYTKELTKVGVGEVYSLLNCEEANSEATSMISCFEDKTGRDWGTICVLMRRAKIFYLSSEELKGRLVTTNLRACLKTAMYHYNVAGGNRNINFESNDLIAEASEGLMHAADMYIHGNEARFTTYAENWIRLKVSRYTKDNNSVRIPIHVTDLVHKITSHIRKILELEVVKSPLEISREDVEIGIGKEIKPLVWQVAMNKVIGISLSISCSTSSSDNSEDGEMTFDMVTDKDTDSVPSSLDYSKAMSAVKKLVRNDAKSNDRNFITKEQYDFFVKSFIDLQSNRQIALDFGEGEGSGEGEFVKSESTGKLITTKYVRDELAKVIEKIQKEMGVVL